MRSNHKPPLALRASVVAVHAALALFAGSVQAQAQSGPAGPDFNDAAVKEITRPVSTIETGVIYVDQPSAKFGEYNGLHREGLKGNVDFEIRGGGAYDLGTGSTERWRVFGNRLGLDGVRELGGEYGRQGDFRLGLSYDELLRNSYDSYFTIWNGAGTSTLTLPPGYPAAGTRTATFNNIQNAAPAAAIAGALRNHRLSTQRTRLGLTTEVNITPQWTVGVNARTEKKEGTKLTGIAFGGFRGAYAPEPVDSTTDIVETIARYTQKDAQFGIGFNLSRYRNHVDAWTAENPFQNNVVANNRAQLSSAPDNLMTQLTLEGAYRFSPTMKVTLAGATARLRQDEQFHFQALPGMVAGDTSARAKEVQTNLLARLTLQPSRETDVNAAYRYEHRDNRTPVDRTFTIRQADNPAGGLQNYRTLAVDRKSQTLSLDGSYRYRNGGVVSGGYEHQRVERSTGGNPTTQQETFASGRADEDTLRAGYRQQLTERLNGQIGYAHSRRRADDYREAETNTAGFFTSTPGFRQFFLNDRNRDKLRAAVDFQASEALSLQASAEVLSERFPATFGTTKAATNVFNLEGSYAASEKLSFTSFATYEHAQTHQEGKQTVVSTGTTRTNPTPGVCNPFSSNTGTPVTGSTAAANFNTDTCRQWAMSQTDNVLTVGIGAKSTRFMGGKLTLTGDALHSRARTHIGFGGGTFFSNGLATTAQRNIYIPAEDLPRITSYLTELRFGAKYALDKSSSVKFGYLHQRLKSSDPQFDLFGITSVQAYIGPGITSPRYHVNAVSLAYVYTFQ